jgi:hypothetical protein
MFKSIKEFFVGKPKVEETPAEVPYKVEAVPEPAPTPAVEPAPVPVTEPVAVVEPAPAPVSETVAVVEPVPAPVAEPVPVVEEIKITTVTLSDQITDAVTITAKSDTIPTSVWPFPKAVPAEPEVKKTRTPVKQKEAVTTKKTTPAITANSKPRKKK